MTQYDAVDEDYEYEDEDRWQDDEEFAPWPETLVEPEPACYACYDTGLYPYGTDRPCPNCGPSRLRLIWWWLTGPVGRWRFERRMRRRLAEIDPNELPF